jgi:hypothetical protein
MKFDPPIVVNCRDRVSVLRELVAWLERAGHEHIVLLDNASTYEPLLDFYEQTPHTVVRLEANYGSRAIWRVREGMNFIPGYYVYTDPDVLPLQECPLDLVAQLYEVLREYPMVPKAGPALYLEDLPEAFDRSTLGWERSLVSQPLPRENGGPPIFLSKIDTTLALHQPHTWHTLAAIRVGGAYQVRHVPWYTEGQPLSEEDSYYLGRATRGPLGSSWLRQPD